MNIKTEPYSVAKRRQAIPLMRRGFGESAHFMVFIKRQALTPF